ncbi:PEP-CTERM sorting domain-containing protein [Microcoleus sp. herbarium2]|uniref:PEP-CTERM sorting domain-containing protein n=1 Tax=Microcoleus sp. herbarium2 TaxID=3055433 RepID=UPI002FD62872
MNHKQMPRLGTAIASTILSLFGAVSLVGVDQAQAAVLHYNFQIENGVGDGSFKVDTSSLTGIGYEEAFVSEGILNTGYTLPDYFEGSKDYYNLAGFGVLFDEGHFLGLQGSRATYGITDSIRPLDDPDGPLYLRVRDSSFWYIVSTSFGEYSQSEHNYMNYQSYINDGLLISDAYILYRRSWSSDVPVSYTLVNTETVPEPLTAGGTALALAGLSWLKHKKKMAA